MRRFGFRRPTNPNRNYSAHVPNRIKGFAELNAKTTCGHGWHYRLQLTTERNYSQRGSFTSA
jgi:hypothetical protein